MSKHKYLHTLKTHKAHYSIEIIHIITNKYMSSLIGKDIIHIFFLNTQKLTHQSDSENKSSDYPARKNGLSYYVGYLQYHILYRILSIGFGFGSNFCRMYKICYCIL